MDCKTARLALEFERPHSSELDRTEADALEHHLEECPECNLAAKAERRADEHVGLAVRDVDVPGDLRERLLVRLNRERDSWYRRWALRRVRDVAAAAAAILAVCVGLAYWESTRRPTIDPEAVAITFEEFGGQPPEQLEQWFHSQGLKVALPRDLDYRFLVGRAPEEFRGVRVARLSFQRGENHAEIFILTAQHFNVQASVNRSADSGGVTVEIRPIDRDTAYLIVYTGGSLSWLLSPETAT